jgi:hypothetical protein
MKTSLDQIEEGKSNEVQNSIIALGKSNMQIAGLPSKNNSS